MSALLKQIQFRAGLVGKSRYRLPWHIGVVLGVKEHQLAGVNFMGVKDGIIELAGMQFGPILRIQAVAIPKRFLNIGRITLV
jgi:hypothetical protein